MRIKNIGDIETQSQLLELRQLIADLYKDYKLLSSDGQHTLDNISDILSGEEE